MENIEEKKVETQPQEENTTPNEEENKTIPEHNTINVEEETTHKSGEKMLTQSEVNKLVGEARKEGRNSVLNSLLTKYGVQSETELEEVFGRGQGYSELNEQYNGLNTELTNLRAENLLLKSQIKPDRFQDALLIIRGKGLEVNEETIANELATHPEWSVSYNPNPTNTNTNTEPNEKPVVPPVIKIFGSEQTPKKELTEEDERNKAFEMFGIR